jgi:hypothetical protein
MQLLHGRKANSLVLQNLALAEPSAASAAAMAASATPPVTARTTSHLSKDSDQEKLELSVHRFESVRR